MLVKVYGSAVFGIEATTITVEVNIDKGIGYHLVGLPDNAVRESSYRISAALSNNKFKLPGKKIIINMAPADIRKEGAAYDLTLAVGILAASNQIKSENIHEYVIMGELSLDGGLQPIKGVLPIAIKAREEGFKGFILPKKMHEKLLLWMDWMCMGLRTSKNSLASLIGRLNWRKRLSTHVQNFIKTRATQTLIFAM